MSEARGTRPVIVTAGFAVLLLAVALLALQHFDLSMQTARDLVSWQWRAAANGNTAEAAPGPANTLPVGKARMVQTAIKGRDYATAETIVSEMFAASHPEAWSFYPFLDFVAGVSDLTDPDFESKLTAWVDQDPSKPLPLLIRAQYFNDRAWFRRGSGYSPDVGDTAMKDFSSYLEKARSDVDRVLGLDPANAYAYHLRLNILRGYGVTPTLQSAFEEGAARYPDFVLSANTMLGTLQPKWGGNIESMYAFVDDMTKGAPADSPRKLLDLDLYRFLLETASTACDDQQQTTDQRAACVQTNMKQIVTADLEGRVLRALDLFGRRNDYQTNIAVEYILSAMLSTSGTDVYTGPILEAAANSYNADTRLRQDPATGQSYLIDKLVAKSWLEKGFDDNARTKYQQALLHIRSATFPSQDQKDIETAAIDQMLASLYGRDNQLAEMVTAAQAALDLGGGEFNRLYICYGFHQLKRYEDAIDTCTRSISDPGSSVQAYYWRGMAKRALHRDDDAAKDLTVVADSQDFRRTTAAIELQMVHFDRNDYSGALEILNRYPYLYDVKLSGKSSVAVSYNNRCYAYMELGDLQKALDDCTASLANGSIPDAYKKQQELIKRLAPPP